jgi:hypothetical protein
MAQKNSQSSFYHQRRGNLQDWAIDRWCRQLKISRQKLEQHPHIADVATLLMFDEYDNWLNQQDSKIWQNCWQWVYFGEMPLNKHHRRQLLNIINGIEYRKQAFLQRQLKRQHIQARIEKKKTGSSINLDTLENGVRITTIKGSANQI